MCPSLVEIRSVTSEIRLQKKRKATAVKTLRHRNAGRTKKPDLVALYDAWSGNGVGLLIQHRGIKGLK